MGGLTGKDSNVTIYMNTSKPYYIAGEYVQGQIYLDVKTQRMYTDLMVCLQGQEHIQWTESRNHGKYTHTQVYSNFYRNYQGHFIVYQFGGRVDSGQYMFPFSFLLPSMMTGSFYSSGSCYLKYVLRAQLVHPTSRSDNQYFEMFLNIMQPPRMPLAPISFINGSDSKCCGCCKSYGIVKVGLKSDKNFVRNGDPINVQGFIDNTLGKTNIKQAKIYFQQNIVMISDVGKVRYYNQKERKLQTISNPIYAGQKQQFNYNLTIPADIIDYTAIGRVVARYFVLYLDTSYGCCANTAQVYLHLIVHSKAPAIVEKKKITAPQNWNPKPFPMVVCQQMVPYAYLPLPQIPFLNLPGFNTVETNLNLQKQMQQMQQRIGYQIGKQIVLKPIAQQYNYQPQFYGADKFPEEQKSLQKGVQPKFSVTSDTEMLMKKHSI